MALLIVFVVLLIVFGVKLIEFVVKYWIYYLYEEYKHRYTQLAGLSEAQLRVNNLAILYSEYW